MKNEHITVLLLILFTLGLIISFSIYHHKTEKYIKKLEEDIAETYQHINSFYYFLNGLPLGSPLDSLKITSKFGIRKNPNKKWRKHNGIDLSGSYKDSVYVTADGVVIKSGWFYGYGKCVIVEHSNGYTTLYAHLRKTLVKKDDIVCKGQVIGIVGNTGFSTGSHLHYEIRHLGEPQDPYHFIIFEE